MAQRRIVRPTMMAKAVLQRREAPEHKHLARNRRRRERPRPVPGEVDGDNDSLVQFCIDTSDDYGLAFVLSVENAQAACVVQLVFVISHGRITHDLLRALLPYPQKFAQWFVLG